MGFLDSIFGGGKDVSATDQRTPEQLQMAQLLQQLATTGSGAGITLGSPYGGSLGSFTPTSQEQTGLAGLLGQQPTNAALTQAQDVFSKMSGAAFDPSVLDPFKQAAYKAQGESNDILNREGAITGTRFGTAILGQKADLAADTQNIIQQKLAELFLNQQNVSLQGASGLAGVGGQQAGMAQQNLQNMFQYGQLERQLKNQEAQAQYNEFTRQRSETLGRVDLMGQEADRNPYMGISSIPGSPSPFSSLINSVLGEAGTTMGGALGGAISSGVGSIGSMFSGLFGSKTSSTPVTGRLLNSFNMGGL